MMIAKAVDAADENLAEEARGQGITKIEILEDQQCTKQPALIVAEHARYHFAQQEASQCFVATASREVIHEVLAGRIADAIFPDHALMTNECMKQFVTNVIKHAKYHSDQLVKSLFSAVNVLPKVTQTAEERVMTN